MTEEQKKAYAKKYWREHQEEIAKYRQEHKEQHRINWKKWYQEHNEQRRAYCKNYHTEHPGSQTEYRNKDWKAFISYKLAGCNQDDRLKNRTNDLDLPFLLDLLKKQDYKCPHTGLLLCHKVGDLHALSIDRINTNVPKSEGHMKYNTQLVCAAYNYLKNTHTDKEATDFLNCCYKVQKFNEDEVKNEWTPEAADRACCT